tara:strand:+ start:10 stop:291 length:282 start_codon:yes stop_codon:yes gene_type:complete
MSRLTTLVILFKLTLSGCSADPEVNCFLITGSQHCAESNKALNKQNKALKQRCLKAQFDHKLAIEEQDKSAIKAHQKSVDKYCLDTKENEKGL